MLVALAACAAPSEPVAARAPEAPAVSPAVSPATRPAAARPTMPPAAPPAGPAMAGAIAAAPPTALAAVPPASGLAMLTGLTGAEVTRLIGPPRFRRADEPAALWQYAARGCVLDLYLHADGPVYRVVHFEFRPDPKTPPARGGATGDGAAGGAPPGVDPRACFAALARAGAEKRG